jgi:IclR family KDG regulon transcriptional repressor
MRRSIALTKNQHVKTVSEALEILQYLARRAGEHGIRDLSTALGISPATMYRLLKTLEAAGFVQQNEATEKYSIGIKAVQLGVSALGELDITSVAPPHINALVRETGESAFLAVLDEGEIVYMVKQEGHHSIRTTAKLGSRRPLHCTGLGKVFLSAMTNVDAADLLRAKGMPAMTGNTITDPATLLEQLSEIREKAYAVDREEIEEGLACVAAPVRNFRGDVVAAVSVAGPIQRVLPKEELFARRITETAHDISVGLGFIPKRAVNS